MLHVALWEPEIPPNTGNVSRLCAATASRLHLIGKLGFRIDDKQLKRAGLDYWPHVDLHRHATFAEFEELWSADGAESYPLPRLCGGEGRVRGQDDPRPESVSEMVKSFPPHPNPLPHKAGGEGGRGRLWVIDNPAPRSYTSVRFADGDCLLFGKESTGLPPELRERFADRLVSIPMFTPHVRSLNLSTAVGIVVYEALRQIHGW